MGLASARAAYAQKTKALGASTYSSKKSKKMKAAGKEHPVTGGGRKAFAKKRRAERKSTKAQAKQGRIASRKARHLGRKDGDGGGGKKAMKKRAYGG